MRVCWPRNLGTQQQARHVLWVKALPELLSGRFSKKLARPGTLYHRWPGPWRRGMTVGACNNRSRDFRHRKPGPFRRPCPGQCAIYWRPSREQSSGSRCLAAVCAARRWLFRDPERRFAQLACLGRLIQGLDDADILHGPAPEGSGSRLRRMQSEKYSSSGAN